MNRIIMLAVAILALTSIAEARPRAISPECNVTMPCDLGGNNFLAGVVSIKVTMHRERPVHRTAYKGRRVNSTAYTTFDPPVVYAPGASDHATPRTGCGQDGLQCDDLVTTPKAHSRRHKSSVSGSFVITPSWGGGGLVSTARAYLGQTAGQIGIRRTLWCSAFLRHITHAAGVDDRAISWNGKTHVSAAVGTIAVMRHHVGIVSGFDAAGNPFIISGNPWAPRPRGGLSPPSRAGLREPVVRFRPSGRPRLPVSFPPAMTEGPPVPASLYPTQTCRRILRDAAAFCCLGAIYKVSHYVGFAGINWGSF
jgi:hypothetical protein